MITLKAEDNGDTLTLMFESEKQDRISDFDLKLMSIESEHLGIPDQVRLPPPAAARPPAVPHVSAPARVCAALPDAPVCARLLAGVLR